MADEVNLDELEDLMSAPRIPAQTDPDAEASAPTEGPHAEEKRHKKHKSHRKHKRQRTHGDDGSTGDGEHKRSRYVLDAAESADSADDFIASDDDSAEEGFSDAEPARPANKFIFHEGDDQLSADELGREYEERVAAMHKPERYLAKGHQSSLRYASHLLPRESDPKVFAVKCRPRMARTLVSRVVNKCYAYRVGKNFEKKKVDLGIISVFSLDHVKEYVYIEAYRKLFVENVLNGLEGVFRYNIAVVNPTELMQMMETRATSGKVRVGSLVRLRQRYYRMDLAQVTALHPDGVHITCKVVPREDFVGKPFNKATTRLPPRFFVPSLAVDALDEGDSYRWGDLHFTKDGYLLKSVSARMVLTAPQMQPPSTEELARFFNNNRERVREAIVRATAAEFGAQNDLFRIGDTVRVASGQLRDTVGTVVNIFTNTSTALLSCRVPGRKEPINLRVELGACSKHFAEGTHVVVHHGEFEGESGTVVKSYGDVVQLFADGEAVARQLMVRANDCHQSKLAATFGHSFGPWQLFDLVMAAESTMVACIVCLHRTTLTVLTERNEVNVLTHAQVKSVPRGARQTTDRLQNILTRGSEVVIHPTPVTPLRLAGQTARIEQIFNRTLFVRCSAIRENAGIVALDASCVLLMGGRTTMRQVAPPKQLRPPERRPHNATLPDHSLPHPAESSEWSHPSEWYASESYV